MHIVLVPVLVLVLESQDFIEYDDAGSATAPTMF